MHYAAEAPVADNKRGGPTLSRNMTVETRNLQPKTAMAGTGLVDVLLAMSVIVATALTAFHLTVSTVAAGAANERLSAARLVMREAMTELERRPFEDVFRAFNDDPSDDPDGPGSGPGPAMLFEVVRNTDDDSLDIRKVDSATDASSPAGLFRVVVVFPTADDGTVSERRTDFLEGFPADLNRDGDAADSHLSVEDVEVLPMKLSVLWEGSSGVESLEMARVFSRR